MNTWNVGNIVIQIIADELCHGNPLVTGMEKELVADLGADSLALINLCIGIETRFGMEPIPDEERLKLKTVADVVNYVVENQE